MKIEADKIANSFGTFIRGKANSLPVPKIGPLIDNYKKTVAQRLFSKRIDEFTKIRGEILYVSVKVDGEYVAYYYEESSKESFFCNSPTNRIYTGLPVNEDLDKIMLKQGFTSALIGGELFATSKDPLDFEARAHISDFTHYSRNPQSLEDLERIGFKAFDILQINGEDWLSKPYKKRLDKLQDIFLDKGRASMVKSKVAKTATEIEKFYKTNVLDDGQEGIVVRGEGFGYKMKPVHTLDAAIIGIAEGLYGTDITLDQLATALVALRNPNGDYQILTAVGTGLTDKDRKELLTKFEIVPSQGFVVPARYDGRVFHLVKPGMVAHIDYQEILTEVRGEPIHQNALRYNEKEERWERLQQVEFVKLLYPRFVSGNPIRTDKSAHKIIDVRVSQVTDVVDVPHIDAVPEVEPLKKSVLLARNVYVKGENALRKVLAWETNKASSGTYPAYVIYYFDYSDGRKTPITRKVRITEDKEQMWEIFEGFVKDEIMSKRGGLRKDWEEFSTMDIRVKK